MAQNCPIFTLNRWPGLRAATSIDFGIATAGFGGKGAGVGRALLCHCGQMRTRGPGSNPSVTRSPPRRV
jgi:hypothetical protein